MKQINQYIFNLYHYLLNLRDTMEYTIKRDHSTKVFESRKAVLVNGLDEKSAFGNFLKNNGENGEKLKAKVQEFIDELYADGNSILVPSGDTVRVDNVQNIKIFDMVTGVSETVRDVLYQYLNYAKKQNDEDPMMVNLVKADERLYRVVLAMLIMRDFEHSFGEFQKVMAESKGQPTPQSNFIVQNELFKLSSLIRFSRQHCKCTDNDTLDLLDDVNKVIEMTEGRRDRPGERSFKDIFDDINRRLSERVGKLEPAWKDIYGTAIKEFTASQPAPQEAEPANKDLN